MTTVRSIITFERFDVFAKTNVAGVLKRPVLVLVFEKCRTQRTVETYDRSLSPSVLTDQESDWVLFAVNRWGTSIRVHVMTVSSTTTRIFVVSLSGRSLFCVACNTFYFLGRAFRHGKLSRQSPARDSCGYMNVVFLKR